MLGVRSCGSPTRPGPTWAMIDPTTSAFVSSSVEVQTDGPDLSSPHLLVTRPGSQLLRLSAASSPASSSRLCTVLCLACATCSVLCCAVLCCARQSSQERRHDSCSLPSFHHRQPCTDYGRWPLLGVSAQLRTRMRVKANQLFRNVFDNVFSAGLIVVLDLLLFLCSDLDLGAGMPVRFFISHILKKVVLIFGQKFVNNDAIKD